jgi:hypothetical protein
MVIPPRNAQGRWFRVFGGLLISYVRRIMRRTSGGGTIGLIEQRLELALNQLRELRPRRRHGINRLVTQSWRRRENGDRRGLLSQHHKAVGP